MGAASEVTFTEYRGPTLRFDWSDAKRPAGIKVLRQQTSERQNVPTLRRDCVCRNDLAPERAVRMSSHVQCRTYNGSSQS
jgi:hypothetical protein